MKVYECGICGNAHDEAVDGVFAGLDEEWSCPVCGAPKVSYTPKGESNAPAALDVVVEKVVESRTESLGACVYVCPVCGNTYDEGRESCAFGELPEDWECSICGTPKLSFTVEGGSTVTIEVSPAAPALPDYEEESPLAYPMDYYRTGDDLEVNMALIHEMAVTGASVSEPMRTRMSVPSFNDIVFLGAQLASFPLEEDEPVKTHTVIGKNAAKPMVLDSPVYVTHMSYGALSAELKTALARGSAAAGTAIGSGEGGILPEEMEAAHKYIFEYVPNLYGATDENLRKADAIEIKIGQGTKPGMGGHLPGNKVTEEIARVRGKEPGEDIQSPAKFGGVNSREDLKKLVDSLRKRSKGRPVGIKIAAGHIEKDLEAALFAKPDFVTVDGRGGGTGSSPKFLKDASSIPTVFALYRARKYIREHAPDTSLIITGGFRTSGDIVKALCMGADAVAVGTAALMAAACMQYRVCDKGNCPTGSLTQDPELRAKFNADAAAKRTENFLNAVTKELMAFARAAGKKDVHGFGADDIRALSSEISSYTDVEHV